MERFVWKCLSFIKLFYKIGLKKGDRVVAYVPNTIESIISFLATSKNGII